MGAVAGSAHALLARPRIASHVLHVRQAREAEGGLHARDQRRARRPRPRARAALRAALPARRAGAAVRRAGVGPARRRGARPAAVAGRRLRYAQQPPARGLPLGGERVGERVLGPQAQVQRGAAGRARRRGGGGAQRGERGARVAHEPRELDQRGLGVGHALRERAHRTGRAPAAAAGTVT